MSKRTREEASPPRPTRIGREHRPSPAAERTPQPPVPAIQNASDTDADSMALIAALLAEDGGRRTRTSVHLPVPINRDRDHSRPESLSRHSTVVVTAGQNNEPSAPKGEKINRDRDRSSRECRAEPAQLCPVPAADPALKSPAPPAAVESLDSKSRSDRDRSGGDRRRSGGSSSSKQRRDTKKTDDSEVADAAIDDSQLPLADAAAAEAEAQVPKRVRRPVAASELAALNVDPKALESLASDHGENEDDETPKMMLRLRKRHDKDEKKDEHVDARGGTNAVAAAPCTPDAHNREDGDPKPKDSSRPRRSEGDSKGGGSDRKGAPRRSDGEKSGQERKDGAHKESHKSSSSSSKKRRESSTPKNVEIKKQEEPSESDGEDDADKWVSCDRCKKWRKLPPAAEMPPKDKKVKWFCEMNILDPARANCSVPEEQWNVSGASINTTNVDSKHNTSGTSPAVVATKAHTSKSVAVAGKNVNSSKSGNGAQGKSNSSANLNSSANSVAETLLLYNSSHVDSVAKDTSSNKNKAKGSNIGDAIVELLLHGGMPASLIEARLVEGKKLELGAASNQNKLSRSLQKLQRAGIVSKERHQGADDDHNVYALAQEELPDLLLSNHDAFFVNLNLPLPSLGVPVVVPSVPATFLTSPKVTSKRACTKEPIVATPFCSPPSTPRLEAAAAAGAVGTDLKLESEMAGAAALNHAAAASPMGMQCSPPIAIGSRSSPPIDMQCSPPVSPAPTSVLPTPASLARR